jgi:hypothetical protein
MFERPLNDRNGDFRPFLGRSARLFRHVIALDVFCHSPPRKAIVKQLMSLWASRCRCSTFCLEIHWDRLQFSRYPIDNRLTIENPNAIRIRLLLLDAHFQISASQKLLHHSFCQTFVIVAQIALSRM